MSRFPVAPPAYGWFQVGRSEQLDAGAVMPLRYFARDLVLWRTDDGRAVMADAFCPHLGAHLGYGGSVQATSLRCPLHGWLFAADGRCVGVPGSPNGFEGIRLRTYPIIERGSLVLTWFHPRGEPPGFQIPEPPELARGEFTEVAHRRWTVPTIWPEIGENLHDAAHVDELHGLGRYESYRIEEDGPRRRVVVRQPLPTHLGPMAVTIDSLSFGPGYTIARFGKHLLMTTAFGPVDDEHVDLCFTFYARDMGSPRRTQRMASFLVQDMVRQTEQHLPIWAHKAYLERPTLMPADEPIAAYRRWAAQFFVSEG